jgi:hypothetical protein
MPQLIPGTPLDYMSGVVGHAFQTKMRCPSGKTLVLSTNMAHNTTADTNKQATIAMLLSPQDVLKKGFHFFNGLPNFAGPWTERRTNNFKSHYGSSPIVLANQWYDLMTTELNVGLTTADKSDKGFKMFLIANHFLWAYPKNAKILGSAFPVCERLVQGDNLWRWVRMIAALKAIKIVCPEEEYNNPHGRIFIISVDGTDFKVWEKKHPMLNETYSFDLLTVAL